MKREKALKVIQTLDFVIHETVLFLDGHPDNQKALAYYHQAVDKRNECVKEYEKMFGPLTADAVKGDSWTWIDNPWPWHIKE